jgi:methionyl-tRNA synthetase
MRDFRLVGSPDDIAEIIEYGAAYIQMMIDWKRENEPDKADEIAALMNQRRRAMNLAAQLITLGETFHPAIPPSLPIQ